MSTCAAVVVVWTLTYLYTLTWCWNLVFENGGTYKGSTYGRAWSGDGYNKRVPTFLIVFSTHTISLSSRFLYLLTSCICLVSVPKRPFLSSFIKVKEKHYFSGIFHNKSSDSECCHHYLSTLIVPQSICAFLTIVRNYGCYLNQKINKITLKFEFNGEIVFIRILKENNILSQFNKHSFSKLFG